MTALSIVTAEGHDTATALTLIILGAICLAFWALAENLLTRSRRSYEDQTAVARTVGVLREQHNPAYDGEFADMVAQRLAERGDVS